MISTTAPAHRGCVAWKKVGCVMDTLDSRLRRNMVDALEERIWLDRREVACPGARKVAGRFVQWLRELRARMQLGPSGDADDWFGGDPDKRL
jgi:hypothetical protein